MESTINTMRFGNMNGSMGSLKSLNTVNITGSLFQCGKKESIKMAAKDCKVCKSRDIDATHIPCFNCTQNPFTHLRDEFQPMEKENK
jgi:hypothetical protein